MVWGFALLNAILNVLCLLYDTILSIIHRVVWYFLYHSGSDSPDQNNIVKKTSNGITWKFDRSKNQILATKILVSISVLLPPYLVCSIVRDKIQTTLTEEGKGWLQLIFGITIILAHLNSFTNANLFLASNVKSEHYLRSFLRGNADNRVNPYFTKSRQKMFLPMKTLKITVSSKKWIINTAVV